MSASGSCSTDYSPNRYSIFRTVLVYLTLSGDSLGSNLPTTHVFVSEHQPERYEFSPAHLLFPGEGDYLIADRGEKEHQVRDWDSDKSMSTFHSRM